uniref:Secreted protein n=1 Tax=Romanomermis culicivorax TaxID=13658 RepID=A0A915I1H3_ROMCU
MQPTAVVAALPSMMTTGAQTLAMIAQQQPVAALKPPLLVANTFGETLCAVNDDVSIIEASPFRMVTALRSPKICILCEVHPCGGLVIDFPGEELISCDYDGKE